VVVTTGFCVKSKEQRAKSKEQSTKNKVCIRCANDFMKCFFHPSEIIKNERQPFFIQHLCFLLYALCFTIEMRDYRVEILAVFYLYSLLFALYSRFPIFAFQF
jgi:hypothetical protein